MRILSKVFKLSLSKEKQLLEKAKTDKNAFGEIYKCFVDDVYRYAYSILNNHHDAEDIASQTFIEFYKGIHKFEWRGLSLKYWLLRTARNLSLRRLDTPQLKSIEDLDIPENYEEGFTEKLINRHLVKIVENEVKELNLSEREVISLRIWEGLKFREIAELQNISENAAKKRFYKSLHKLQNLLEKRNIRSFFGLPLITFTLFFIGKSKTHASAVSNKSFINILIVGAKNTFLTKMGNIVLLFIVSLLTISLGGYYIYKDFGDENSAKKDVKEMADLVRPTIIPELTNKPTPLSPNIKPTQSFLVSSTDDGLIKDTEDSEYLEEDIIPIITVSPLPTVTEVEYREPADFISPIPNPYLSVIRKYYSSNLRCLDVTTESTFDPVTLVSSEDGRVEIAGYIGGGNGFGVVIDHGKGIKTYNYHMAAESILVKPGDNVLKGQGIGTMGMTESDTGVHTKFCLEKNGEFVDPTKYIDFWYGHSSN